MKTKNVLVGRLGRWVLLVAVLLAETGLERSWAQAPAWQSVTSGYNNPPNAAGSSSILASATDASGNIFVTGVFSNTVRFGNSQLTNAGTGYTLDVFVAKWDIVAQAFTWATSGGGTSDDYVNGIAVSGRNVFITGNFNSGSNARFAGQLLTGAGSGDMFVAKYVDTSTGHTSATSSFANAWAASAGGTGGDDGRGIAVYGSGVFITGSFTTNAATRIAGQTLTGAGLQDMFVAKYVDTSTGNTPATSSYANGWATSGGGTSADGGIGVAANGSGVYVTGSFTTNAATRIAGQTLIGAGSQDMFVAKYVDTSTGNTPATSSYANGWATSGGGTSGDVGGGITLSGRNVFVTGSFFSGSNASIAGQPLTGVGSTDMFVAKYVDTSTGNTPATSSFANGWATSGGGTGDDVGHVVVATGPNVFVAGSFTSNRNASIAGQVLAGVDGLDAFVAKYVDTSTGSTPATSSVANGWATGGGGVLDDEGNGIVVRGQTVSMLGVVAPPATFGNFTVSILGRGPIDFLARLTDPTLPLATQAATPAATAFTLSPNPARTACTVQGAPAGAVLEVFDALGRTVAAATADATGTAVLALPAGLPPGVYVVRGGGLARRLAVE